jgi:alkanesulfonate monooxygenase
MQQLARAIDHLGFSGALLATGPHDTWVLGASLIPYTERMRFLIAVHPGLISPILMAKMALTFEQFSRGRLLINVVNGDSKVLAAYGYHLPHDERYALCDEYLTVWRQVVQGETVNFAGKYVHVKNGKLALPTVQQPHTPLWFGGSSPAALEVAAKHIDTYLSWGETPPQVAEKIANLRSLAAQQGRTLKFGIRLYVIVRDKEQQAWDAAEWLLEHMDAESISKMQKVLSGTDSVGQQRMLDLHGGRAPEHLKDLEIYPNLWAGLGLVRPGPGTAIIGDPEIVAARLQEYADVGIDTFILSGIPLLEEAYRVAETVLPLLPVSQTAASTEPTVQPFTWNNSMREGASIQSPVEISVQRTLQG